MNSNDIPGQEELKAVIRTMITEDRVPHALLVHSREGGASLSLVRWFIELLLCDQGPSDEPCGTCHSCTKNKDLSHPDVHYTYPVNTNKKNSSATDKCSLTYVDEWREAVALNPYLDLNAWYKAMRIEKKQGFIGDEEINELRPLIALRSYEGGYKVFVIWHADKMNAVFANKILKNLEEPSPKTVFILISEQPSHMLSTILSRVQWLHEDPVTELEMSDFLQQKFALEPERAVEVAFRSEGNVAAAVKDALHQVDPWSAEFMSLMRLAWTRKMTELFQWSEKMAANNRDEQRDFCGAALTILDRCHRLSWLSADVPATSEEATFIRNFSPFINFANLEGLMELFNEADTHIGRNVYEKLVWFDLSIKCTRLLNQGKLHHQKQGAKA